MSAWYVKNFFRFISLWLHFGFVETSIALKMFELFVVLFACNCIFFPLWLSSKSISLLFFFSFGRGHTQWCSKVTTLGTTLRRYLWQSRGSYGMPGIQAGSAQAKQMPYPMCYCFRPISLCLMLRSWEYIPNIFSVQLMALNIISSL